MEEKDTRARDEIAEFVAMFPQVKPEEIPAEVWQKVKEGQSLALAYAMDRMERLEKENASLTAQLKGKALSAGSVTTAGSALEGGTLASYWDAYQM